MVLLPSGSCPFVLRPLPSGAAPGICSGAHSSTPTPSSRGAPSCAHSNLSPPPLPTPSASAPGPHQVDTCPLAYWEQSADQPPQAFNFPSGSIWLIALTLLNPPACWGEYGPLSFRNITTGHGRQHGLRTQSRGVLGGRPLELH